MYNESMTPGTEAEVTDRARQVVTGAVRTDGADEVDGADGDREKYAAVTG